MGESMVVSGGGALRLLDLPRGRKAARTALEGVQALCAGRNGIYAASRWGEVIWRLDTDLLVPTGLFAGGPGVCRMLLSRDGSLLYVLCSEADSILMLDAHSGAPLLLNRVGVGPCAMAMDAQGRRIAVAGGGSGEVIVLDAGTLRVERRLATCGMVFSAAIGSATYAMSLEETMNTAVTAFFHAGGRCVRTLPGMPGALVLCDGMLLAATHAGLFALDPATLRVCLSCDVPGRACQLIPARSGLVMIDQWSDGLFLREAGRWRLLCEQAVDAALLRDT